MEIRKRYYKAKEVADLIGVSRSYVYTILKEHGIDSKKIKSKEVDVLKAFYEKPEICTLTLKMTQTQKQRIKKAAKGTTITNYILTKLEI